jgi:hypothetical protein
VDSIVEKANVHAVIASGAKQSSLLRKRKKLDCFIASLLAMTEEVRNGGLRFR